MYNLMVSFSPCLMVSRWFASLFGRCPLTKLRKKEFPNYSKLSMDDVGDLVNHSLAAHLRVVGKERHNISSGDCWRPKVVLKVLRWSKGSFSPSNGSNCGRRNFKGIGILRLPRWRVNLSSWPFGLGSGLFFPWLHSLACPSPFSSLEEGLSLLFLG